MDMFLVYRKSEQVQCKSKHIIYREEHFFGRLFEHEESANASNDKEQNISPGNERVQNFFSLLPSDNLFYDVPKWWIRVQKASGLNVSDYVDHVDYSGRLAQHRQTQQEKRVTAQKCVAQTMKHEMYQLFYGLW